jgi:hypothetical protein
MAVDGNLYGTTGSGTAYVLYKLTPAGVFTAAATLVSQSYSPLLLCTDGNLYGTTLYVELTMKEQSSGFRRHPGRSRPCTPSRTNGRQTDL